MMSGQNSEGASPWVGGGLIRGVPAADLTHGLVCGRHRAPSQGEPVEPTVSWRVCIFAVLCLSFSFHEMGLIAVLSSGTVGMMPMLHTERVPHSRHCS